MDVLQLFANAADAVTVPAGQTVLHKGEAGDRMYVVLEGEVYLVVDDRVLEVAGPGSVIGEMGLIEQLPRGGDAVARTDCKLAPVDAERFQELIRATPEFALHVMRVLSERLRRTTKRL